MVWQDPNNLHVECSWYAIGQSTQKLQQAGLPKQSRIQQNTVIFCTHADGQSYDTSLTNTDKKQGVLIIKCERKLNDN
jgi:hypothetical protein